MNQLLRDLFFYFLDFLISIVVFLVSNLVLLIGVLIAIFAGAKKYQKYFSKFVLMMTRYYPPKSKGRSIRHESFGYGHNLGFSLLMLIAGFGFLGIGIIIGLTGPGNYREYMSNNLMGKITEYLPVNNPARTAA